MGNTIRIQNEHIEPQNPSPEIKIPTTEEVFGLFNQFLQKWAGLSANRILDIENSCALLPLEWELMFVQPLLGILIFRTTLDFESKAEETSIDAAFKIFDHELLEEMVVLFWRHFASKYWNLKTAKTSPRQEFGCKFPRASSSSCLSLCLPS